MIQLTLAVVRVASAWIAGSAGRAVVGRRGGSTPGQTLIEYGLLLSLIAVVAVIALIFLGPMASDLYSDTGQNLE